MSTKGEMGKCENSAHPETEKGEMFLMNVMKNEPYEYARIRWSTKRKGKKAYDIGGVFLPYSEPVFVQRKEYIEGMKKKKGTTKMEEGKRNYNVNHPELEEGEMFLTNVLIEYPSEYTEIGWVTKRKGERAYTIQGESIKKCIPVFVQRKEYEEGVKKYEK